MPLDADLLVDRRRLKRQLSVWRTLAVVALVAVIAAGVGRAQLFGERHVARLSINGVITDDPDRTRAVIAAGKDSDIKALIVRIDSPGGTVVGGESLFRELSEVARQKPVVAVMGELAASGGYMIALAAEQIFAREGTITGSIGVILQTTDVTGLLEKLGVTIEAIKSAPLKAVPSPLEPLTDEGRRVTACWSTTCTPCSSTWWPSAGASTGAKAVELADGRVYTGRQAKALGLIDAIGGEDEARAWLAEAKGVSRSLPVRELKIQREDEEWSDWMGGTLARLTGKTYLF